VDGMTQPEINRDINSDDAKCKSIATSLVHLLVLHLVTSVCQEIYIYIYIYIDIRVYLYVFLSSFKRNMGHVRILPAKPKEIIINK